MVSVAMDQHQKLHLWCRLVKWTAMKNQFLKIKKKAEPGSQPYVVPPPHLYSCPHHRWSGGRVAAVTIVEEPRH
jgi:hypothetical protein